MAETKKYVRIKKAKYESSWYVNKIGELFELTEDTGAFYDVSVPGSVRLVNVEDAELIVTEKCPAKVGERVLITKALPMKKQAYEAGDVFEVATANDPFPKAIRVFGMPSYIDYREYEVIVNNEVKNEEADGMKIDLNAMGDRELYAHGEAVMEAIKKRMFQAGFRAAKQAHRKLAGMNSKKSAQARRDEIVEQAKADVEKLSNYGDGVRYETGTGSFATCNVEFVANRDKRTVVALLKGVRTGDVYAKGIAKAAPGDCFNVHIGKAIALRRALGLTVPDEYLNAPQPTEVRVGDVIEVTLDSGEIEKKPVISLKAGSLNAHLPGRIIQYPSHYAKIINDSREEVGE
ncbi:hypothetical protein [Bacillus velezensis]|uniref:hypothetical protein n=1 Tax=Bacillus velezensis TaxID=492670 RepID=UPI00095569FE|nr:hypothetical protein [Bacillus velezensis]SIR93090.1 hypothetical protein SAMN05880571_1127 [Bacillus velezensis]